MLNLPFKQRLKAVLLISMLAFYACSKGEPQIVEEKVYHVVDQEKLKPGYVPLPFHLPFYGHDNFIVYPNGKTYYYRKSLFLWDCTGELDDTKPEYLGLLPQDMQELNDSTIQPYLNRIYSDSALYVKPLRICIISSPVDTIKQKHFKLIFDVFTKRNLRKYVIRKMTEEERVVLDAKLKGLTYNPDSIDWKEDFGGLGLIPTSHLTSPR